MLKFSNWFLLLQNFKQVDNLASKFHNLENPFVKFQSGSDWFGRHHDNIFMINILIDEIRISEIL